MMVGFSITLNLGWWFWKGRPSEASPPLIMTNAPGTSLVKAEKSSLPLEGGAIETFFSPTALAAEASTWSTQPSSFLTTA